MTHVKALQAGHSSQGTSEPITPVSSELYRPNAKCGLVIWIQRMRETAMVHMWHTTTTLTKCVVVWCCGCCFEYPQQHILTKCVVVWCCGCCFEYPQQHILLKCVVVWCCGCCFEYPQQHILTKMCCCMVLWVLFRVPTTTTLTKCVVVWCCGCCFEYPQQHILTKCVVVCNRINMVNDISNAFKD